MRLTYSQIVRGRVPRKKAHGKLRREMKLQTQSAAFTLEAKHNLAQGHSKFKDFEYDDYEAIIMSRLMEDFKMKYESELAFAQQYLLKKGLKSSEIKEKKQQ